jgi:tetratricopeptide (TPR) repeat protein
MIANAVDFEVLEALNPARPLPPTEVEAPTAPDLDKDFWLDHLREQLAEAKTRKQRADFAKQIADRQQTLQDDYRTAHEAYGEYQAALSAWRESEVIKTAPRWLNTALLDLETRGLLQCDRQAGKYDLHPVVRGYAIGSLNVEARAQTGQLVADYFSSQPTPSYATATSLEELGSRIQVVQALNLSGNTQAAWVVLSGDLQEALRRLEYYREMLALLRPLFPGGWSSPPAGIGNPDIAASQAAGALNAIGLMREAAVQGAFCIQAEIKNGIGSGLRVNLRNYSNTLRQMWELARSQRMRGLALDVAVAAGDTAGMLWCEISMVNDLIEGGSLTEARARWTDLASRSPDAVRGDKRLELQMLWTQTRLLFRERALTAETLASAVTRARTVGEPVIERWLLRLAGDWHHANGQYGPAVESYAQAIGMARAVGLHDPASEAGRGLSLARLGRRSEAEEAAASAERDPPHDILAELYWTLEDRGKARHHAREGYKLYWADGPPYALYWRLQTCRTVLHALGEPEPQLPPYDPARIAPIEFEADIRRLLAEHTANKNPAPE